MGQDQGEVSTAVGNEQKDPAQIREEIEETRQDLGDTAAALAAKTDVKARAKEKVAGVKQSVGGVKQSVTENKQAGPALAQVSSRARQNPIPTAAVGALIAGFLIGRITKRS